MTLVLPDDNASSLGASGSERRDRSDTPAPKEQELLVGTLNAEGWIKKKPWQEGRAWPSVKLLDRYLVTTLNIVRWYDGVPTNDTRPRGYLNLSDTESLRPASMSSGSAVEDADPAAPSDAIALDCGGQKLVIEFKDNEVRKQTLTIWLRAVEHSVVPEGAFPEITRQMPLGDAISMGAHLAPPKDHVEDHPQLSARRSSFKVTRDSVGNIRELLPTEDQTPGVRDLVDEWFADINALEPSTPREQAQAGQSVGEQDSASPEFTLGKVLVHAAEKVLTVTKEKQLEAERLAEAMAVEKEARKKAEADKAAAEQKQETAEQEKVAAEEATKKAEAERVALEDQRKAADAWATEAWRAADIERALNQKVSAAGSSVDRTKVGWKSKRTLWTTHTKSTADDPDASFSDDRLHHEGELVKEGHERKSWKTRQFKLFDSGHLRYYEKQQNGSNEPLKFKREISLRDCVIRDPKKSRSGRPFALRIEGLHDKLIIDPKTKENRCEWQQALERMRLAAAYASQSSNLHSAVF